jgi:hypothetical protein
MSGPTAKKPGLRLVHSVDRSDAEVALEAVAQTFVDWLEEQYRLNKRFDETACVEVTDLPEDPIVDQAVNLMTAKGWGVDVVHYKSAGCNAGAVTLRAPRSFGKT